MSIWSKFKDFIDVDGWNNVINKASLPLSMNPSLYAFVDVEVGLKDKKIHDIGALRHDDAVFHRASKSEFLKFLDGVD